MTNHLKLFFALFLITSVNWLFAQEVPTFQTPQRGFYSNKPAVNWQHSLISGNGTMGALVYGQPYNETIVLSHSSLYLPIAKPKRPISQRDSLAVIRQLLLDGKGKEAAMIAVTIRKKEDFTPARDPFIPAFILKVNTADSLPLSKYQRSVDFKTGVAKVAWQNSKGTFVRSLFVSRKDSIVVLHIKGTAKINCAINLEQLPLPQNPSQLHMVLENTEKPEIKAQGMFLTYRMAFKNSYRGTIAGYAGAAKLNLRGGSAHINGKKMIIADADEVTLLLKIQPLYRKDDQVINKLEQQLEMIRADFKELLSRHAVLHGAMFGRVKLNLYANEAERKMPTEELLKLAKTHVPPALIEKLVDAGRYNIISCTGTNPPNLVGIWSGTWMADWFGGFTHDGNLATVIENNLSGDMPELMDAFFSYHESRLPTYRDNAKYLYNARGIHIPAQTTDNGLDTDFGPTYCLTFWTGAAGWTAHYFYDYYLYTGDQRFLKDRAFPFMKEAALFYKDFLKEGLNGKFIFNPSYSPENTPANSNSQATINATMDVMIAKQLLSNCIQAARILHDTTEVRNWQVMLTKMPDYEVAPDGTLKEWLWPGVQQQPNHRHSSHLYALFDEMNREIKNDSVLLNAVNRTLDEKMNYRRRQNGGDMAFGLVQLGLTAAHINEGERAGELVNWLASNYWSTGLGSFHNVGNLFNMDISGGLPALINEMLVYSEPGKIELLPALPKSWKEGTLEGVLLRGQLRLEKLSWKPKELALVLVSKKNQNVELSFPTKIRSIRGLRAITKGRLATIRLPKYQTIKLNIELE